MPLITVISQGDLDPTGPTAAQVAAGKVVHINALAYVRLLLQVSGLAVAVRPWYYRDGAWRAMRADGATPSAGSAPCTASPGAFGGTAEAWFAAGGLSYPVAVVVEAGSAGTPNNVSSCLIEPCEIL